MAETIKIGGELESMATGNVVAAASTIKDKVKNKYQGEINAETDAALDDRYTKSQTYNKTELNNMITTPNQEFVTVTATDQTTAVTDVLPATGSADTVYRVGSWNGTQYEECVYSEYSWNGSAYVHLSIKTEAGEVYDISAAHATGGELATYADLAAALGTNGANIPQSLRKGGMSVKFVQSSDNKYVQFRFILSSFTAGQFVDVNYWESITDVITKNQTNSDLDISDENFNTLVRFKEGHIETKNFNSKHATDVITANQQDSDLEFGDENGNILVRFKNGHIETKNFNSEDGFAYTSLITINI